MSHVHRRTRDRVRLFPHVALLHWIRCGVTLLLLVVASRPIQGQERLIYSTVIDSLSGSPTAFRTGVHRRLLEAGFSIREVAACDCLVATDAMVVGKEPTEFRVHILRPPNGIVVRVVVQALVGPPSGALRSPRGAPPREVQVLMDRLREDVLQSRIPTIRR